MILVALTHEVYWIEFLYCMICMTIILAPLAYKIIRFLFFVTINATNGLFKKEFSKPISHF